MADPVDIEVRIKAAKAEATLAKLSATVKITADRLKQAGLRTQILEERLKKTANASARAGKGFKTANIAMASFIGNITSRAVSASITTLINGFRDVINTGREFESALVQISKTTGLSIDSTQKLGKEIQAIGKRIPIATKSLLDIAKVAGQLGIKSTEDILAFTETMSKLQLATDIAGEEGTQAVAKILNITGELRENGAQNIVKFGSVITKLGNDFAATESQILAVAKEVSKGTTIFKVASEDVLALATAFKVTGSEAAISGTTIQKVFQKMGKSISDGGQTLTNFAEASGLTEEAFETLFRSDPVAAFAKLTKGLGNAGLEGIELTAKLNELGFTEARLVKSLAPLIVQNQVLADSIKAAREEAEKRTALDEETRKAQETLNADLIKLSNSWQELSTILFGAVGPALRGIIQELKSIIDNFSILLGPNAINTFIEKMQEVGKEASSATGFLQAFGGGLTGVNKKIQNSNGLLGALAGGLAGVQKEIDNSTDSNIKLDKTSSDYVNTLNSLTGGLEGTNGVLKRQSEIVTELKDNYVELADGQTNGAKEAAKQITLFEQDKTKAVKKFFKAEEIARLEAKFNFLTDLNERKAFAKFVAQQGNARQQEAFKRTLGIDRATIESSRKRQQEINSFRKAEADFALKLDNERVAKEEELLAAKQEADSAARAVQIVQRGELTILRENAHAELLKFLDLETLARLQAAIEAAETEEEKQLLIERARKKASDIRLKGIITDAKNEEGVFNQKNKFMLRGAAETFGGLSSIAKLGGKKNFEISKAFAIAEATVRGVLAVQQALTTPPGPPITIPFAIGVGVQAAARVATIASTKPGFEQGGVVGGSSFTGDKVEARVNSGEMILTRQQQKELFNIASGQNGGSSEQPINITTKVMISDDVVGEATSRWVANGGLVGEVQ